MRARKTAVKKIRTRTRANTSSSAKRGTAKGPRIRMYNVGFGDCFLVTLPIEGRPRHILIDCGYHSYGPPPSGLDAVVKAVIDDVTTDGKAAIDVVIATHRHKDHVEGFANPAWKKVQVSEVWMPWTEHPTDPEAKRVREAQSKKAKATKHALDNMRRMGVLSVARHARANAVLSNSHLTNAAAMDTLHGGFAGNPTRVFLPRGEKVTFPQTFEPKHFAGLSVHVLGPGRDPEIIRDMNPPKNESFMRFAGKVADDSGPRPPFDIDRWAFSPRRDPRHRRRDPLLRWLETKRAAGSLLKRGPLPAYDSDAFASFWVERLKLSPSTLLSWEEASHDDEFAAVVALEAAVNGTSLLLAFEFNKHMLLFPGDAQWGTWHQAMENPKSRDILSRTTFYKVGHHGSHNATPKQFVKDIVRKGVLGHAMVSTTVTDNWHDIPRLPLLKELQHMGVILARSDDRTVPPRFERVDAIRTDLVL